MSGLWDPSSFSTEPEQPSPRRARPAQIAAVRVSDSERLEAAEDQAIAAAAMEAAAVRVGGCGISSPAAAVVGSPALRDEEVRPHSVSAVCSLCASKFPAAATAHGHFGAL